jgi:hypothetical protein
MTMEHDRRRPRGLQGLELPGSGKGKGKGAGKKKDKKSATKSEVEKHAKEVREVIRGRDIVERPTDGSERVAPTFGGSDLLVVRSWMKGRPFEPRLEAAALVHFPRQWSTRRGRYCRFQAPGAGSYGLLRARPTF